MFYDILEGRNACLGDKKKKLKKWKNWVFFKRVSPWFWQKLVIFPDFYFRENRLEKCVLRYSRKKKRFSRL